MRIIINDNLFTTEEYDNLSKDEFTRLCKIVGTFAKNDQEELSLIALKSSFDITEDFIKKTSFCINYGKVCSIKNYFTWIKGNKAAVAKSRAKKKELGDTPVQVETKVEEKPVQKRTKKEYVPTLNGKRIVDMFNEHLSPKGVDTIKKLNKQREEALNKLYKDNLQYLDGNPDIYEFYEGYFCMLAEEGDKYNYFNGWYNKRHNAHFKPGFDYLIKDQVFTKLLEGNKKDK